MRVGRGLSLRDLARSRHARQVVRYASVSLIGVVITQVTLVVLYHFLGVPAAWSNVIAVCVATVPSYSLQRAWTWGKRGRSHWAREVAPFWGFTIAGLGLSTLAVSVTRHFTDATVWIMAANLSAFGVLWVAQYIVLDVFSFGRHHRHPAPPTADPEAEADLHEVADRRVAV